MFQIPNECCSSFPGKIDEIPGISVDNFERAATTLARAYFLSHYHLDHIQGIDTTALQTALQKTKAIIYTSKVTAVILCVNNPALMQYVRGLETGLTQITLPATEQLPESSITVTLIPANHCTGSTMFLFTTEKKQKILYTGDFRIDSDDLRNCTSLQENGAPIKLDTLYIDTTFIGPEYDFFPKRSECVNRLMTCIRLWLAGNSKNKVAICTPAKYGYDTVFNEIYNRLGVKVHVDGKRWKVYREIQDIVPGVTNNKKETRIHLCNTSMFRLDENLSHAICGIEEDGDQKFLYVCLTATRWENYDSSAPDDYDGITLRVCYATHCSRREIYNFVDYLSPDRIIGFPKKYIPLNSTTESMVVSN